jgi:hypothetical protein
MCCLLLCAAVWWRRGKHEHSSDDAPVKGNMFTDDDDLDEEYRKPYGQTIAWTDPGDLTAQAPEGPQQQGFFQWWRAGKLSRVTPVHDDMPAVAAMKQLELLSPTNPLRSWETKKLEKELA